MSAEEDRKTIVITGGSSGIGAAAARALARRGARVVITGRSAETARLASELGCDHYIVDFARFSEVRQLARTLLEKYPRIDVLANNVGGIFGDRRVTEDGHEMTFQVNHLSAFLLTQLLMDRLVSSRAMVVNTSSAANRMGSLDFDDVENAGRYWGFRAYGTAKLMNILHAKEISRRFPAVSAASFHPGPVATGFAREGGMLVKLIYDTPLNRLFLIPPERGADTLVWLATTEPGKDWTPGEYYDKRKPGTTNSQATSENARRLWDLSETAVR
ncbi:MAG: SDR family NAD(P)-dependent oxidoreductase [Bacteroidales bacterium]